MVLLRPNTIKQINAGKVASDFTTWCKQKSNCMYKDKKRKYHGWINLSNLSKKNGKAQCGWDDGDCNHTTHYGVGGYHNICAIGGINGDYPWPAKLQFSNFKLKTNNITSASKIKSITVTLEHRMVAIDVGTGIIYDNFGPTFHSDNGWATKMYFTKGSQVVSDKKKTYSNPKLSKTKYNSITHKFTGIDAEDLVSSNFALNLEYNHNYNTEPGIIYLKNVSIDIDFENASEYISGKNVNSNTLFTSREESCSTTIIQEITAGYKNGTGKPLGEEIQCVSKPKNVSVTFKGSSNSKKVFEIKDNSLKAGTKNIIYQLSKHPKKKVTLSYNAVLKTYPSYSVKKNYKVNEDFDENENYLIVKNGCAPYIDIYIDSLNSTPMRFYTVQSDTNMIKDSDIRIFHDRIKQLSCGSHILFIRRGKEAISSVGKNKITINVSPMNFDFEIYTNEITDNYLEFNQSKNNNTRYSQIIIKRVDNEPISTIPSITINDETQPNKPKTQREIENITKGQEIVYNIDKYYSGEFYISISTTGRCGNIEHTKQKIIIKPNHKQNYDYLFTRGEDGTTFDFDYLVAWEGDNIREPLLVENIELTNSIRDINICSDSAQAGLSNIGIVDLFIKNKKNEAIEGIDIELNTLIENNDGDLEVTTREWIDSNGIFNQFYQLFYDYNKDIKDNVEILNLTPDNDLIDEENVYLSIKRIEANNAIKVQIPFRSVVEKTVYLQYLLMEDVLPIHKIGDCDSVIDIENAPTEIEINVIDSMLTNLEIIGNTDLLKIDESFNCPNECFTTKDMDNDYNPIQGESGIQTGGITYRVTNVDTNNFENQRSRLDIINSNELIPYGYILNNTYYSLFDDNGNQIDVEEKIPMLDYDGNQIYEPLTDELGNIVFDENNEIQYDLTKPVFKANKIKWVMEEESNNKPLFNQNIFCEVSFPQNEKITYTIKTDKNGLAEFFIPIPKNLNENYTINQLLEEVVLFRFKETNEYNEAILTKNDSYQYQDLKEHKDNTFITYKNNYKNYKPGEIAYIPVYLSVTTKNIKNYIIFNAELHDNGDYDEVTVLYKICNIKDNQGIFQTTFKTNDKKLIKNEISKNIYCGIDTNIILRKHINKKIVENKDLNIIYIDVLNTKKENKDVEVEVNLGKICPEFLGEYDFINIDIDTGDYSIRKEDDNIYINWLIGEMNIGQKENAIIKIQASDVGLSRIYVKCYDYLHQKNNSIDLNNDRCNKCEQNNKIKIIDSEWKEFDGIMYKSFPDGYKRPGNFILKDNKYVREWIDKDE